MCGYNVSKVYFALLPYKCSAALMLRVSTKEILLCAQD